MHEYNIREIASGLGFIEAPVALEDGRVLVVDVKGGTILSIDPSSGKVSNFARTGGGPNGMALGPDGALYLCNNGGLAFTKTPEGFHFPLGDGTPPPDPSTPGIQRVDTSGRVSDLYVECAGHPLVAPNDLVFDDNGGFYFTDLGHPHGRLCDLGGLYYAKADGSSIIELIHEVGPATPLTQPNGVSLSPRGDRVYAAETVTGRIWGWAIERPGVIGPMPEPHSFNGGRLMFGYGEYSLFDSMAVDGEGYICVATLLKGGITVIKPQGGLETFIPLPERDPFVTNICFGGPDLRTAYVTAAGRGKLWAMDWPRRGLRLNYAA